MVTRLLVAGALLGFLMADGCGVLSGLLTLADAAAGPVAFDEGAVSVVTDKFRYQPGETIVVRVTNPLNTAVTTWNQRFQCTIITLEHQHRRADGWTEVRSCFSGAPVSEVTLQPGSITTIHLEFGSGLSAGLDPGHYRAALDYSLGDRLSLELGDLMVARSDQFEIEWKGDTE